MKKILKYEARRVIYSKKTFILVFCVIVLALVCLLIGFNYVTLDVLPEGDRTAAIEEYKSEIIFLEGFIKDSKLDYYHPDLDVVREMLERYRFFLSSSTTEYDYMDISDYMGRFAGFETFGRCFFLCEYSVFPFIVAAVFAALWGVSFERSRGMLKNLLLGLDRRKVFDGKLISSSVLAFALPVLFYFFDIIVMLLCRQRKFLVYAAGGYAAMSGATLLLQIALRNLMIIAFFYAATLLCSLFFKPLVSGLAVPLGVIFTGFVAMIASNEIKMVLLSKHSFQMINAFPVIGFFNYAGGFDAAFWIMAVLHCLATASFLVAAYFRFMKMDI